MEEEPDTAVVQMDSVEGKKGGAVLLTIHFVKAELMLAFYREHNDARSVTNIFDVRYERLGKDDFMRIFPLLLADNGAEFSNPKAIEFTEEGERRTYVYYCDPNASQQKGSEESLNGIIKTEALYCRFGKTRVKEKRVPISEILEAVTDFISYYNNERPKASNGGLSPVQFRLQNPKGTYLIPIDTKGI